MRPALTFLILAGCGSVSTAPPPPPPGPPPGKLVRHDQYLWIGPNGSAGLYGAGAQWPEGQSRVHVLKLYVDAIATPGQQTPQVVATAQSADIHLAIEVGGLREWQCSGTAMAQIERDKIRPLVAAGGTVGYLAMDSPFGYTIATGGAGNCGYSIRQAAESLAVYMSAMRQTYPGVRIGLIEPVPWYRVGTHPSHPGNDFGDLPRLLDTAATVRALRGEHLDFVHADSPYDYNQAHPTGWQKLRAWQDSVRLRGIRFGLTYNSDVGGATSDQMFHQSSLAALDAFLAVGGAPDDFILQSWYPYPMSMAPETTPYTFTYLVKHFIARYDILYP